MVNIRKIRIISAILLVMLIIGCMPIAAQASGSFSAYVKDGRMKVYSDEGLNKYAGSLGEKTIVTVKSYSGDVAQISYKGKTGYAKISDMGTVESISDEAVTTRATYVYKTASTRSARVKVGKGVSVNVLAVKSGCAMIERGGNIGYMYVSHLKFVNQAEENLPEFGGSSDSAFGDDLNNQVVKPTPAPTPAPTPVPQKSPADKLLAKGELTNEEMIFVFAVKKMGYNEAAACGLVANIKYESGFRPNAEGDSGRSYGICQWFSSRKTRLISWCEDNGYDYQTMEGQLYFLKYELEKYYPSVHKYLKNVDNDAQGAYDAAYYFCYNFEAPANRASKSNTRGNYAKNTTYPKFT